MFLCLNVHVIYFSQILQLEFTHNLISHCEGAAIAYKCFGELFSSFVKGWDEKEKSKAYSLVQTTSRYIEMY